MKNRGQFLKKINTDAVFYVVLGDFCLFAIILSIFRDANADETIYIHETYLMAELLKNGIWMGDYAVGLHGFLFKLPPALIFIFTGPSVFLLTCYNIFLAAGVGYFFYRFLREAFKWDATALAATGILMTNFHFILATPTYLREMPSLAVVMLLCYGIFKQWRPWVLSIVFLLLLDAKEYLFFMFGAGYFIWIVLKYLSIEPAPSLYQRMKNIGGESARIFSFSFLYMVLMFTTSLIPVNMFLAALLGLVDRGMHWQIASFSTSAATANLLKDETAKTIFQFMIHADYPLFLRVGLTIINTLLAYIGKILYPRTFSFIAVPKLIMAPAFYMALKSFKRAWNEKASRVNQLDLILPIFMLTYLLIFVLHASHGRYLLPIVPIISIYFVSFIYHEYHHTREVTKVLMLTLLFVIAGFFFEISYIPFKVALELFLFICLAITVSQSFRLSKKYSRILRHLTIACCVLVMGGVSVLYAMTQGQVKYSTLFGRNREIDRIVELLPEGSQCWINGVGSYDLMAVYAGQTYSWPEWGRWGLADFLPKKYLLKTYGDVFLHSTKWRSLRAFEQYIWENDIEYVVMIESTVETQPFRDQQFLLNMIGRTWLPLETVEELRNKTVYLFKVDFPLQYSASF